MKYDKHNLINAGGFTRHVTHAPPKVKMEGPRIVMVKVDSITLSDISDSRAARTVLTEDQRNHLDGGGLVYMGYMVSTPHPCPKGIDSQNALALVTSLLKLHGIRHDAGDCHTASAALRKADGRLDHWRGLVVSCEAIMTHSWNVYGEGLLIDATAHQLCDEMEFPSAPDIVICKS